MAIENFTTYDETDVPGWVTVAAAKLTIVGMEKTADVYVTDDKGAAHFGATFEHEVDVTPRNSQDEVFGGVWAVSNVIDDWFFWATNNSQAICVSLKKDSARDTFDIEVDSTEPDSVDAYLNISVDTTYYLTIERTSETALEVRIYSDAERTSLTDTLNVAVTNGRRFQHIFGCVSWNDSSELGFNYDVENLDLKEAAAAVPRSFGVVIT